MPYGCPFLQTDPVRDPRNRYDYRCQSRFRALQGVGARDISPSLKIERCGGWGGRGSWCRSRSGRGCRSRRGLWGCTRSRLSRGCRGRGGGSRGRGGGSRVSAADEYHDPDEGQNCYSWRKPQNSSRVGTERAIRNRVDNQRLTALSENINRPGGVAPPNLSLARISS